MKKIISKGTEWIVLQEYPDGFLVIDPFMTGAQTPTYIPKSEVD